MSIEEYDRIYQQRKSQFDGLRQIYNPDDSVLRKYQMHLAKTLDAFDIFCKQHDIQYYIAYGTLLGAIRQKDFVCWDDDIDIWMTRDNYTKLAQLMKGQFNQLTDFLSVSLGIRPELWSPPAAYIDIFILDKSPKNAFLRALKEWRTKFLYIMVKSRSKLNKQSMKKPKPYLLFAPIAIWGSNEFWKQRFEKNQTWLTTDRYTKDTPFLQSYCATFKGISQKLPHTAPNGLGEPVEVDFAGYRFPAPQDFERILKLLYGDFMSLPKTIHDHGLANDFAEKIAQQAHKS